MVSMDGSKDLVTVKGTMNVQGLISYLKEKLKTNVEVVPVKKDDYKDGDGSREKKKKKKESSSIVGKGGGDPRKKQSNTGGGGGAGNGKVDGGSSGRDEGALIKVEGREQLEFFDGYSYYSIESAQEYTRFMTAQMMHGPQLFSDENPNACSIM